MADRPLFNLDTEGRWRLAYDSNQWVLQKARLRKTPRPSQTSRSGRFEVAPDSVLDWRGVSFVGSEKRILRRLFREKGISLTAEAQARLEALPEQFMDFIAAPERFAVQWAEAA